MLGVDCASGDTFTDGTVRYAMSSIRVPDPVMSLAIVPKSNKQSVAFSKALQRFQKEDPTFKVESWTRRGDRRDDHQRNGGVTVGCLHRTHAEGIQVSMTYHRSTPPGMVTVSCASRVECGV